MTSLFKNIKTLSNYLNKNITKQYSNSNKIINNHILYYNENKHNDIKTYEEILSIRFALGLTHFDESKIRDNIDHIYIQKNNEINKINNDNIAIRIVENPFCCNQCGNCSY
jgi:hypothetical protein